MKMLNLYIQEFLSYIFDVFSQAWFYLTQVIDFLVAVEKLTEEGFPEDDVEIALSLYNDNDRKVNS